MKLLLIVLFSIISQNLYCQEAKYSLAEGEIYDYFKINDSLIIDNKKEIELTNSTITKLRKVISRPIDFKLSETIYDFTLEILLDEQIRYIDFKLHKYFSNGEYCGLILNNINSKEKRIKFAFNKLLSNYLNTRNKFYDTSITESDFVKQNLSYKIYGDGCGYEMKKTKIIDDTILYELNNAEIYVTWMKSTNLELQMWGFNQLDYLAKKDLIEFENDEGKIFKHIRKRNAILETCLGCTIGLFQRNWN